MTYENMVILLGNVGKEPEFQGLQNGGLVVRFSLATSTGGFTTKDGKDIPKVTQWHNIVCWDKNAEYVHQEVIITSHKKDRVTFRPPCLFSFSVL